MEKEKQAISLYISKDSLKKIDEASKKLSRSRSNFLEYVGLQAAEKTLNETKQK